MKSRYLLGAGAALAVAFGCAEANAQFAWMGGPYPVTYYLGPEGGWTSLANQRTNITTSVPFRVDTVGGTSAGPFFNSFTGSARYNSGFNVGVRGGVQYGPWRLEEEYSYRHNNLSQFASFYGPAFNSAFTGQRNTNGLMTNVIYDFGTWGWNWGWLGWPVTPHIGFGIGAVENQDSVNLTGFTIPASASPTGALFFKTPGTGAGCPPVCPARLPATVAGPFLSGSQWNFGYQAIAGLRFDISPVLAFDIDYRYLASTQPTFNNKGVFPLPNGLLAPGLVKYTSGYNTQNIVGSLTIKFGAPPPPPPPAPPAPPPPPVHQVFLVFFDWDKYNITPEGQRIIALAADHYKAGGRVQLTVTGFTDTTGSASYNQRLSERRANTVAAALERLGVPRSDMIVSGRGMNDLRVPTPPGVREPQNRRVEIVFP